MKKLVLILWFSVCAASLLAQPNLEFFHTGQLSAPIVEETLPIEVWNDLILIKAKINGVEGTFIYDNGFSATGIDVAFAEKAKVSFADNIIPGTDGNNVTVGMTTSQAESLELGKVKIMHEPLFRVDMKQFGFATKQIDGLVGASAINLINWSFNFDEQTVKLSSQPFKQEGVVLPYKIEAYNLSIMTLRLNDYPIDALIDFGSNADQFLLNIGGWQLFTYHPTSQEYGISGMSVSGLSAIDTALVVRGDYSYTLAGQSIDYFPDIVLSRTTNNMCIGNRYFRHFNTVINSTDTTYILSPRKTLINPYPKVTYGVKLLKVGDKVIIGKISTNPNVRNKPIELLSEVKLIDGESANRFIDNKALIDYQNQHLLDNKDMQIELKDGTSYTFSPELDEAF